jgi:hypothetical protein
MGHRSMTIVPHLCGLIAHLSDFKEVVQIYF